MNALFLAFEGGEGVGKSTQIWALANWLSESGHTVRMTFEPGDTPLGSEIRRLVLDPASPPVSVRAETLLYAVDRAHHVDTMIRPALEAGEIVLTDRYLDSTLAYQGVGRSVQGAREITEWAAGGVLPTLTVLLDLDPVVGLARAKSRSTPDRLEADSLEFHRSVRQAFLDLAAADPGRYLVIDATEPPDLIAAKVRDAVTPLL